MPGRNITMSHANRDCLPDSDEITRRIVADFATIGAGLQAIAPPAGHRWEAARSELTWFAGDVLASTRVGGASIFLRRFPPDDYDPDQLHVELRVFWSKSADEAQGLRHMWAIVWALHGVRIAFQSRSLLNTNALFLHAEGADALLLQARGHIEEAFRRFHEAAPAHAVR